jgi:hypothetical protein
MLSAGTTVGVVCPRLPPQTEARDVNTTGLAEMASGIARKMKRHRCHGPDGVGTCRRRQLARPGKSPAVAPIVSGPTLATSIEPARKSTTVPDATRRLLWYFEGRGGFWRVGQLIGSRTATRGRQKGRTLLEIQGALNRRVSCYIEEIKWGIAARYNATPLWRLQ